MSAFGRGALLALALLAGTAHAQRPHLGQPAPELALEEWIGVAEGEEPTLERLKGRAVMIEFWGTWCAPCVQLMPHVQELHDRYADLGLVVLAISYEPRATVEPFARKNGYTFAFGCDPRMEVVGRYGIGSWPTTFVLDERGRVAWIGTPTDAEPAIERALGLPADAAGSLQALARATRQGDVAAERATLSRLIERRPHAFDLARWARIAPGGPPADEGADEAGEPALRLDAYLAALAAPEPDAARAALGALARSDAHAFDLLGWARARYRERWPLEKAELEELLRSRRYPDVVEGLMHRAAASELVTLATADSGLQAFCVRKAPDARSRAKKGLMVQHWIFAGVEPKNSQRFWSDLGVAGLRHAGQEGPPPEVRIGSDTLAPDSVPGYVDEELELSIALGALASGRAPTTRRDGLRLGPYRARLLDALRSRYGAVERSETDR